jgi:hypothetical protein
MALTLLPFTHVTFCFDIWWTYTGRGQNAHHFALCLKVHKRENFFYSDFEFFTFYS